MSSKSKRRSPHADVSCAVCGRPLTLWEQTTALDGRTVCASGCLADGILRMREHNGEATDPATVIDTPPPPLGGWQSW